MMKTFIAEQKHMKSKPFTEQQSFIRCRFHTVEKKKDGNRGVRWWKSKKGENRMGLWKIDNVSKEEWERRMMRRHSIKRWLITIGEILLIAATIWWIVWVLKEIRP